MLMDEIAHEHATFDNAIRKHRAAAIGVCIAMSLCFSPMIVSMIGLGQTDSATFQWALIVFVAVVGLSVLRALRTLARLSRAQELVPSHDGKVCPECVIVMEQTGDEQLTCPKCNGMLMWSDVRKYWDTFATDNRMSMKQRTELRIKAGNARSFSWTRFTEKLRDSLAWKIGYFVAIFAIMAGVFAIAMGQSVLASFMHFVPMILLMFGVIMFMAGLKWPVADASFCAACQYQRPPDAAGPAPQRCPECGAAWNAIGGTRHGRTTRKPRLIFAGSIVAAIGFYATMHPGSLSKLTTSILPTGSLIQQVTNPRSGFVVDEWNEIVSRNLSDDETIALATGLLDRRNESFIDRGGETWLAAQITANALPDDLVKRYYEEDLEIWLVGPTEATVGETVRIAAGSTHRAAAGMSPAPFVLVSGFFVDDETEPKGRRSQAIDGIMFGRERKFPSGDRADAGDGPVLTLEPTTPGTVHVRLELWIAHLPTPGTIYKINWNDDGTPTTSVTPTWLEHRMFEHVVEVSE